MFMMNRIAKVDMSVNTPLGVRAVVEDALTFAEGAGDESRAGLLRLLLCAVQDRDDAGPSGEKSRCGDAEIIHIVREMIRQREIGAQEYEQTGEEKLAQDERTELDILRRLLPVPLSDDKVQAAARRVVADIGASGLKDLGRCVGEMKRRYPGRIAQGQANDVLRQILVEFLHTKSASKAL